MAKPISLQDYLAQLRQRQALLEAAIAALEATNPPLPQQLVVHYLLTRSGHAAAAWANAQGLTLPSPKGHRRYVPADVYALFQEPNPQVPAVLCTLAMEAFSGNTTTLQRTFG